MRVFVVCSVFLYATILHAEFVCLKFSVSDYEGIPIRGATVALETAKKRNLPYARAEYKEFSCTTDKDGVASERFFCWDGKVFCTVTADGYYPETIQGVGFKTNYDMDSKTTVFYEDNKKYEIKLRRIMNPVPMTRNRILRGLKELPNKKGKVGFDLEKGDFVKPYGVGAVADFFIDYEWNSTNQIFASKGKLIFPGQKAGAYVATTLPSKAFPVDYSAKTNNFFAGELCYSVNEDLLSGSAEYRNLLGSDEYMVVRSRVVLNANGKILKANYSQIHGPFIIGRYIEFKDSYFNPRVNDINLEYQQNLPYSKGKRPCQ